MNLPPQFNSRNWRCNTLTSSTLSKIRKQSTVTSQRPHRNSNNNARSLQPKSRNSWQRIFSILPAKEEADHKTIKTVDLPNTNISVIDPSYNIPGKYDLYVNTALGSLVQFKDFLSGYWRKTTLMDSKKLENTLNAQYDRKCLVLDLDETLIHADFEMKMPNPDCQLSFEYQNEEIRFNLFLRPGVIEFLHLVSQYYEVVLFTASVREYADAILSVLDPHMAVFSSRFYRDDCINLNNLVYLKDLSVLNVAIEKIAIVDNSIYSFATHLSNGMLISSFYYDKEDSELIKLVYFLANFVLFAADVRVAIEEFYGFGRKLGRFLEFQDRE